MWQEVTWLIRYEAGKQIGWREEPYKDKSPAFKHMLKQVGQSTPKLAKLQLQHPTATSLDEVEIIVKAYQDCQIII